MFLSCSAVWRFLLLQVTSMPTALEYLKQMVPFVVHFALKIPFYWLFYKLPLFCLLGLPDNFPTLRSSSLLYSTNYCISTIYGHGFNWSRKSFLMGFSDENEEGSICIALVVIGKKPKATYLCFLYPRFLSQIRIRIRPNPKLIPALMQIANDDATSEWW